MKKRCILQWVTAACLLAGPAPAAETEVAMNMGAADVRAADGTVFEADGSTGADVRRIDGVRATQDPALYAECIEGEQAITRTVPKGAYDLTFYFTEPGDAERSFDVLAEGRTVIDDIDVAGWSGETPTALTVTVPDIVVEDGALDIALVAGKGRPLLCAWQARRPHADEDWQLAWSDEFDTDGAPDASKWNVVTWPPRRVNDEDQAYTDRRRNLRVEDGMLVIEAHRERYRDAAYTSGRLHSAGKGDLMYGRVEVRAKLPRGRGTWPAIWMMPTDSHRYATSCDEKACDAWPNSGEMDIMEHVGYQMNHVHGTMHTKAYYWVNGQQRKGRVLLDDVADAFHVYALEWTSERIDVFVDDTWYFSYVNEHVGWEQWPFDHPFHVILNVAVGGFWGRAGGPIDESAFPQRMLVDYVRLYKRPTNGGD